MHIEAAKSAEEAVRGTKIEVAVLRADVSALRAEVNGVKNDLAVLRSEVNRGQVENCKEFARLHQQSSNQARFILAGGATIASIFFGATQYLQHIQHKG
jgi:hypothetical protein